MIKKLKNNKEEIILFANSAAIMMIELLASRILAPYVGTSYIVWVSIIGIIMGSLSVGYIIGGKLADKSDDKNNISIILTIIALYFCFIIITGNELINQITELNINFSITIIIINLVIFAMPNILFGMINPIIYKIKLNDKDNTGKKIGMLNAISTVGSIVGTFLVGFLLLPVFGTKNVLFFVTILLVALSIYNTNKLKNKLTKINLIILIFLILFCFANNIKKETKLLNVDFDSKYSRIMIKDIVIDNINYRDVRVDPIGIQSIIEIENPNKLISEYTKYYDLVEKYNPEYKNALFLGGGAYSYPKYYIETKSIDKKIDVVEIDEKFTELAKKYFGLKDNKRLKTYNEDARMFIEKNNKQYDVIFNDCYNSISVPPQLLTLEFIEKIKKSMNKNGVYIMNLIAPLEGDKRILDTLINTVEKEFKVIDIYQVHKDRNLKEYQNIILVATNNEGLNIKANNKINYIRDNTRRIFTDDNCPIDIWILKDNNLLRTK